MLRTKNNFIQYYINTYVTMLQSGGSELFTHSWAFSSLSLVWKWTTWRAGLFQVGRYCRLYLLKLLQVIYMLRGIPGYVQYMLIGRVTSTYTDRYFRLHAPMCYYSRYYPRTLLYWPVLLTWIANYLVSGVGGYVVVAHYCSAECSHGEQDL